MQAFSSCYKGTLLFAVLRRLLIAVASLVAQLVKNPLAMQETPV